MASHNTDTLELELPSTFEALEHAVAATRSFVEKQGVDEDLGYDVVLLVSEAATNAMKHGNRWDASRTVTIRITVGEVTIAVSVEDEGDGFDMSLLSKPPDLVNEMRDGGRGLFLMYAMATEVAYDRGGRRVRLLFSRVSRE